MTSTVPQAPVVETDAPAPARRRRRPRPRWIVFGVLLVALVVGFGWLLSWWSVVPVRSVTVTGAAPTMGDQIIAAAGISPGTALRDIDRAAVAERVAGVSGVESVDVVLQRPFTVDLQVTQRFPFAVVAAGTGWTTLDSAGEPIADVAQRPAVLPQVNAPAGDPRPGVVALAALPPDVRRQVRTTAVTEAGQVTLTLAGGTTVTWGTAADSEMKGRAVTQLLRYKPRGINVSVPQRPALVGAADLPKQNRMPSEAPIS